MNKVVLKKKKGEELKRGMMHSVNKPNIVIIFDTPFYSSSGTSTIMDMFAQNYVEILEPLSSEIYLISGGHLETANAKIHSIKIKIESRGDPWLIKAIKKLAVHLDVCFHLFKLSKRVDIVIFHVGTRAYAIPIICAKLLRKKVVSVVTGLQSKIFEVSFKKTSFGIGGIVLPFVVRILEKINFSLADRLAVEAPSGVEFMGLEDYREKIIVNGALYIDTNVFKIKKSLIDRRNLVGYIGRLSEEKGVLNFVKAIPKVLEKENKIKFLVGGDGQLRDKIEEYLDVASLNDKIKLIGWIPDEEFSAYLNELKLFVLPSYTEGLPYTLLKAMACGTPVLATPVGAIPDVIKDGETGFLMENNSPQCIAKNVVRALAHPNINEITKNARALVEETHNYQAVVDGYRIILSSIF